MDSAIFYNISPEWWLLGYTAIGQIVSVVIIILIYLWPGNPIEQLERLKEDNSRKQDKVMRLEKEAEQLKASAQSQRSALDTKEKEIQKLAAKLSQTEIQDKNLHIKDEEEISHKKLQVDRLEKEAQKLKIDAQSQHDELVIKDNIIKKFEAELAQLQNNNKAIQTKASEDASHKDAKIMGLEKEAEQLKASAQSQRSALDTKEKEVSRLTSELERLNEEYKEHKDAISKLKKSESDINALEELLDNEKKALHEIKLHMQENKMKVQLLSDKTKDTVESIAQFAQGKEFDEFRKSIHLDEIIQKYEDQIKALKLEKLEIEKNAASKRT